MKSQTERQVRRPEKQRSGKPKRYYKQTAARIEARRDGKPLIFGWGKHLSHSEKMQIQRRGTWVLVAVIVLMIVGTVVGFWINNNIIVPGLPITSVNGHAIPQSQYRKLVALKTQLEINKIYGPHGLVAQRKDLEQQDAAQLKIVNDTTKQIDNLNKQIRALPPGPSQQRTTLDNQLKAAQKQLSDAQAKHQQLSSQITNLTQNTLPLEQQTLTVPEVSAESATWLQEDELIREWLASQSSAVQAKVNPTDSQIQKALDDLKANIPTSNSYSNFLSQMNITDDDVRSMLALTLRRGNMQNYLASLIVSPAYQVLARAMTIDTQAKAEKIRKQLLADNGSDFGQIARKESQDPNTSSSGGSLGWLALGQYAQEHQAAVVENWMFDPHRTLNEISPVLKESGSYHIVQILGIDPARPIDPSVLKTLKDNALADWLLEQKALPATVITQVDSNKELDPMNLPPSSILPQSAPAAPNSPGLPGQP